MRSWWLLEAAAREPGAREAGAAESEPRPARILDDHRRADICIVGGGFTGLWTALRIIERAPDTEVVIVEADICGGGASGRNGGFAMSLWHHFQGLERVCGSAEALRLARASCDAVAEIGGFCDQNAIDAGYRHD
jgi:glycine/D-amino acid oxidase-like deaminating enzyme